MSAKFKVSQLAAKAMDFEMVHPVLGDTGIMVKLVGPNSAQFRAAHNHYASLDNPSNEEGTKMFCSTVIGWDEEAFEMACTPENVVAYFSAPENDWAASWLINKVKDYTQFFHTNS